MECRDIRELADSFLAEELLTETNHEILRHVESCPTCRDELRVRRRLREQLRQAFRSSADLAPGADYLAGLHRQLRERASVASPRQRVSRAGWWAIAAAVLLASAASLLYVRRERPVDAVALARDAAGDHRNCAVRFNLAEKPVSLAEAARRYNALYRAVETVPSADVHTSLGPARVLERHACVYRGRRYAHIVFSYRNAPVSLLIAEDEVGRPTGFSRGPAVTSRIVDETAVASFHGNGRTVYVVGDLPADDVVALATAVASPVAHALAGL